MLTRMFWEMPAAASNVPFCRKAVRLLLEHNSIEAHDVDDVELVLGELCSNVIRHAYPADEGSMEIEMCLDDRDLVVSVSDTGRGMDAGCRDHVPAFTASGGMGFYLMERFSDHLRVIPNGHRGSAVTATRHVTRAIGA